MTPFDRLSAVAAPLLRNNIDTDAIIPSREMTSVGKTGLAAGLFAGWRYNAIGSRAPNPDFILNRPDFADAAILLSGENFGCGSSREHAAWALAEYGFRVVIAPSFNPIFRGNCVRNGIVPVEADATEIAADLEATPGMLTVDLPNQTVTAPSGRNWSFTIEDEGKTMLLGGLDAIDLTLIRKAEIAAYHDRDRQARPWAYL
ncbi:3-isopropylmalate dehydratase small subunit [Sphingomonas montanisoli]|uniref:3-isopropylmalate dehydratase small subunit n=1 Tax=Sphingomonas montanisoli TaxID=2606412 RepID=A0A5D9C6Y3_9SPHN|nr:3-isopropylmalate dehydratase small subunit [Sphingomonas montanisoli]TZG27226.1 3-isopropylmalate dehydratase small subunit [Sphingomonas montanisoli]